jgi:hypothetical protein
VEPVVNRDVPANLLHLKDGVVSLHELPIIPSARVKFREPCVKRLAGKVLILRRL